MVAEIQTGRFESSCGLNASQFQLSVNRPFQTRQQATRWQNIIDLSSQRVSAVWPE